MSDPVPFKTVVPFIARFTLNKVPVTDALGVIYIYRLSDFKYWNDVSGLWEVPRVSNDMNEISETNQTGDWIYNFDTAVAGALQTDEYIIEMVDSAVAKSDNTIERLSQTVGGYLDLLIDDIKRVLALQHDNFVMDPLTYDINGSMVTGVVRAYETAANADTDNGVTGILYKYDITGVRTVEGFLGKYTQTRQM